MQASIALVLGIVIGAVVLLVASRAVSGHGVVPGRATTVGWSALWLGLAAFAATGLMMVKVPVLSDARSSIALTTAALVVGFGAAFKRDRYWPTWVGLAAAAIPGLFWILFVVAEFVGPAH